MKEKVSAFTLMMRVYESFGRQRFFLKMKEAGCGLFLHEVKVQKELCEAILEVADTESGRLFQGWAKKALNDCNEMIAKLETSGVTDLVDEIGKIMEKEKWQEEN